MINPETNKFEPVEPVEQAANKGLDEFVNKNGDNVDDRLVFSVGETVVVRGYKFKVARINEDELILAPVGLMYRTVARKVPRKGSGASKRKRKSGSRRR